MLTENASSEMESGNEQARKSNPNANTAVCRGCHSSIDKVRTWLVTLTKLPLLGGFRDDRASVESNSMGEMWHCWKRALLECPIEYVWCLTFM